jgi:hypothetical protein
MSYFAEYFSKEELFSQPARNIAPTWGQNSLENNNRDNKQSYNTRGNVMVYKSNI